ncbi:hypothetical protein [Candidatus Regiella insecticola]|nr:hypothetical protein [Candidatus Regiella insecticola]
MTLLIQATHNTSLQVSNGSIQTGFQGVTSFNKSEGTPDIISDLAKKKFFGRQLTNVTSNELVDYLNEITDGLKYGRETVDYAFWDPKFYNEIIDNENFRKPGLNAFYCTME